MSERSAQPELFAGGSDIPEGFLYNRDFVSPAEERDLIDDIRRLTFSEVKMHGVVANRRTVHLGVTYDFQTFQLSGAPDIPAFLLPVRSRAAELCQLPPDDLREALITEYQPGAGIGWHRDAPHFGTIIGISLLNDCTMQFRPWPVEKNSPGRRRGKPLSHYLASRSAYVLKGVAREKWQHRIPTTEHLRYSITFRTLRLAGG